MRYNVMHESANGTVTVIRRNVSLQEANEAFNGIDNTWIEEAENPLLSRAYQQEREEILLSGK